MGREIRRVPKGWEHPRHTEGRLAGEYRAMYDGNYTDVAEKWLSDSALWQEGNHPTQLDWLAKHGEPYPFAKYFSEYSNTPDEEYYRTGKQCFSAEDATCYQIYQTVSEGTPTSPVFETKEEMRDWLIGQGHSERSANAFVEGGWAPSGLIAGGVFYSGIDAAGVGE